MSFAYPWVLPARPRGAGARGVAPPPRRGRAPRRAGARSARRRCCAGARRSRRRGQARSDARCSGSPHSGSACWPWPVRSSASARARWCAPGGTCCCCSISPAPWAWAISAAEPGSRRRSSMPGRWYPHIRATASGSSCSAGARSSRCRSPRTEPRSGCSSTPPAPTTSAIPPPTSPPRSLTAVSAFEHEGEEGRRAVLIVSDGESGEGDLEAAIEALRERGAARLRDRRRHDWRGAGAGRQLRGAGAVPPGPPRSGDRVPAGGGRAAGESPPRPAARTRDGTGRRSCAALVAALGRVQPRALAAQEDERAGGSVPVAAGVDGGAAACGPSCHPERSEGSCRVRARSLAALGMTVLALGMTVLAWLLLPGTPRRAAVPRGPVPRGLRRLSAAVSSATAVLGSPSMPGPRSTAWSATTRRWPRSGRRRARPTSASGASTTSATRWCAPPRSARARPHPLLDAVVAYEEALRLAPADAGGALESRGRPPAAGGRPDRRRAPPAGGATPTTAGATTTCPATREIRTRPSGRWRAAGLAPPRANRPRSSAADEARRLLEAVERQQLTAHEGRRSQPRARRATATGEHSGTCAPERNALT